MSLNLGGLTAYVDENKMPLIKKSVLGGRTLDYITVQPDIKSTATINIIDSDLVVQAGGCGWSQSGTTSLTQRELSVCNLKINEVICVDDLQSYYTQKMMNPGSYNETIPFEEIYADEKAGKIGAVIEDMIWKGNTDSGVGNLALCDGFIELLDGLSASTIDGNPLALSALTANNVIGAIDALVNSVDVNIIDADDLVLFVGYDTYRLWATALRNANMFHYTGAESQEDAFSQMVPGTNVKVIATKGLNGSNRAYLSRGANFYFGTDLLNDAEDFKIWYSEDNDEVRFASKFKVGVQVAFPEFVSVFKLV